MQKHDARQSHFDLRLELDGVLKSWAVTRGPSLDPAEKRLAVRTDDHPVARQEFEDSDGTGAEAFSLWDRGVWQPRGDPHEGLDNGLLKFDLSGGRLRGGFVLVRLGKKAREVRENWLLIKESDSFAERGGNGADRWWSNIGTGQEANAMSPGDRDVRAGHGRKRGRRATRRVRSKLLAGDDDEGGPPASKQDLHFFPPQLAMPADAPPKGDGWVHEVKYDGYRLIAAVGGGHCRLWTRSGLDWTRKFPDIAAALGKIRGRRFVLDGEAVVLDEKGRSGFADLQKALNGEKTDALPISYCVFDLLEEDGADLRRLPLLERKARLEALVRGAPPAIVYSTHIVGHGEEAFADASKNGLEGIVSKRAAAPYVGARTGSWLKIKCHGEDEFVIGGYRPSDAGKREFASLLIGEYDNGKLVYRGRVGTGFGEDTLSTLGARLTRLERATSPFAMVPADIAREARWVEPQLVAVIAYREQTEDGVLRHPAFLGLRSDKAAKEVQMSTRVAPRTKSPSDAGIAGVRLTHPDKVMFPEAGLSKTDHARYLAAVSRRMLPFVKDRPLALVRCPDGTEGARFFQKHLTQGMPSELGSIEIEQSDGKTEEHVSVSTKAALVSLAQIGALEVHIWGSRADDLERPDRLVLDLDPDPSVGFDEVIGAANDIRDLLDAAGLKSFPLVTGGKGIHVVVPLERRQGWDEVKAFAKGVATRLADNEPGRFVATMSKAKRKGRIFIDWLRNERGATAIAPYSVRAKPHAPVAMPVTWTELKRLTRADAFTLMDALRRIDKADDAWAGYFTRRQRLSAEALKFFASDT